MKTSELQDREMLELAAKAAGINGEYVENAEREAEDGRYTYHFTGLNTVEYGDWNPLADDGDALRLAAALKIDIEWQVTQLGGQPAVEAYRTELDAPSFCVSEPQDDYRRAIVRAAAAIGEQMEKKA